MATRSASPLLLLALFIGCGGESPPPKTPSDKPVAAVGTVPPPDPCPGDSCLACGDARCPTGWFCDEGTDAGPSCQWMAACASDASCGCLGAKLPAGCSCADETHGARVTCS